ncbi:trypsin-like peptidase domain-containing protein [Mycobacterium sp. KBS0706]|uniref:S1 family peptidase n=1 Tax=Mycobacterium sp. KBS0706 TaxID=2578109 RepID=UPI00110FA97D|nr:serine protease [Mycobacterium sp. KBS0706]TSD86030.1 trypsin-like peptidase domain-containing protein [Mycobacterium sp. KBS0706]
MIAKAIDELASSPPPEVMAAVKLLNIVSQDQLYFELIARTFGKSKNFEQRKELLNLGHFTGQDFLNLVMACGDTSKGTAINIVTTIFRRLVEWGLIFDNSFTGEHSFVKYQWNKNRIAGFCALRILDNVLFGPSYVAQKYRRSVPAVFVEKCGDYRTGTGFVTAEPNCAKSVIITAKHNVDPADGITFLNFSEPSGMKYGPLAENWILHPELDLALLPVECSEPPIPIFLIGEPIVLSRTITLGYPTIATTNGPYILAHGGEVNALVKNYYGGEYVIISNIVAPGNSGGPVLDEAGLCIGLVVNAFESQHEGGVSKSNAAIPSAQILDFVAPYL